MPFPAPPSRGTGPCTLRVTRSHTTRGRRVLRAGASGHVQFLCPPPASVPHLRHRAVLRTQRTRTRRGVYNTRQRVSPRVRGSDPGYGGQTPGRSRAQLEAGSGQGWGRGGGSGGASGEATGAARGGCGVTMPRWALSPWHLLGSGAL